MENKKNTIKDYLGLSEVFGYFFRFFGKNENKTSNINIRVMHGINKISIVIFLLAITFFAVRYFLRS